ncbi:MAG: response regulator transcription factor [Hydrogenibacillus sp.]|nr:response regulator transcription factor [Hydrogenibacillus sp.]
MEAKLERILIIEDEAPIAEIIAYQLEKAGYAVETVADGRTGFERAAASDVDLVILDLMLPELDGLELLRRLRQINDVPVIVLTAKDAEVDKVVGLELGADDYVTKPFSSRELIARVRAHLRRAKSSGVRAETIAVGPLTIDLSLLEVYKRGRPVPLTQREYDVLLMLIQHRGQVVTREQLLNRVWGYAFLGDVRTVDVTVRRLREKIEDDPSAPKIILTRRGAGYYISRDGTDG